MPLREGESALRTLGGRGAGLVLVPAVLEVPRGQEVECAQHARLGVRRLALERALDLGSRGLALAEVLQRACERATCFDEPGVALDDGLDRRPRLCGAAEIGEHECQVVQRCRMVDGKRAGRLQQAFGLLQPAGIALGEREVVLHQHVRGSD